jgi:diguanylate cyclase (GGDEF)-like protein/PAS domain S-box-containing protein
MVYIDHGLLATIIRNSIDAIIVQDFEGFILSWNHGAEVSYGYTEAEAIGRNISEIIPESRHVEERQLIKRLRQGREVESFETQRRAKDGRILDVWVALSALQDEAGKLVAIATTERDITLNKQTAAALQKAHDELEQRVTERTAALNQATEEAHIEKELFRVTLKCIGDAVITTDIAGNITSLNPVAEQLTGWNNSEAIRLPLTQVFKILNEPTRKVAEDPVHKCLRDGQVRGLANDTLLIRRDGQEISIDDSAAPIFASSGEIIGAVLIFRDVTERRRLTEQLTYQAGHDPLTGLVNRREFESRLKRVLASSNEPQSHMLLYLDLDQFKSVNDTCGHGAGDELLRQVSVLLRSKIRARDTVARLGGDEFGILLENCSEAHAERLANSLRKLIKHFRFEWQDKTFTLGVSIGLVPIPPGEQNISEVLSAADSACYAAKEKVHNQV